MNQDPRLRLLDPSAATTPPTTAEALRSLDSTHIVIRVGPTVTGAITGALAATIALLARLFPQLTVERDAPLSANWWGAASTTELLHRLDPVRPASTAETSRTIIVSIGDSSAGADWYLGGGDYTARIGRGPQPLDAFTDHALGVHAAACLLVSQILLQVLAPHGFTGVQAVDDVVFNLVDYDLKPAPEPITTLRDVTALDLAVAGIGSVGSSALALLATAEAPALRIGSSKGTSLRITTVDPDPFDPTRNPFRYPALLGGESSSKAAHLAARLQELGMSATPVPTTVGAWARSRPSPGWDGLLLSSVDTLPGRQDVTDVLARETLSLGVDGLTLHAQRERFADGFACPFCDYVSVAPPLTQAGIYSSVTGLPVNRVLALLADDQRLDESDLAVAVAAGRLAQERVPALVGARLADLVRQAYAEIELRGESGASVPDPVAIAAPQVSWFAGVLAAVEVVKQLRGVPLLDRRVDFDLTGLPAGLVRRMPQDKSGRCLCRSGVRIKWYQDMYPT